MAWDETHSFLVFISHEHRKEMASWPGSVGPEKSTGLGAGQAWFQRLAM